MQGLSEPKAVTSTNTKHLSNMNTLVRRYKTNIYSNQLDVQSFFAKNCRWTFLWKYVKEAKDELSSVVKSFPTHDINMDSATNVDRSLDIQQEQTWQKIIHTDFWFPVLFQYAPIY